MLRPSLTHYFTGIVDSTLCFISTTKMSKCCFFYFNCFFTCSLKIIPYICSIMENTPNLGGRPPIYEPTQENFDKVAALCESYFDTIGDEPPLVTMLSLHLGFCNKSTLYDYGKIPGFSNSIKKAITKIEAYHERKAAYGDKCVGNIFILKNFDWKDKQDINHTGNVSNLPPTITFVDE